jgi:hypothetical protein
VRDDRASIGYGCEGECQGGEVGEVHFERMIFVAENL